MSMSEQGDVGGLARAHFEIHGYVVDLLIMRWLLPVPFGKAAQSPAISRASPSVPYERQLPVHT